MRICIKKSTGKLIESQSGGRVNRRLKDDAITDEEYEAYLFLCDELENMRLNTLKQNAINAGHLEADIEVRFVTDEEYAIAKAEDPNEIARIAEQEAKEAAQLIKAQAYIDNLPSWATVKGGIDAAFTDAKQNGIITKLARVVYWDIKNTEL
jgi:hypothetical protein